MTNTKECPCCHADANSKSAWLIETANQTYWNGHYPDARAFTSRFGDAVLFTRKEDAELIIHWLLKEYSFAIRSAQHMWVNGEHK